MKNFFNQVTTNPNYLSIRSFGKLTLLFLFFANLNFTTLHAQTITWVGTTADWNTASNWDLNVVPSTTHDVIIPNVGLSPSISGGNASLAKSVIIQSGVTLTIVAMSSLTIDGSTLDGIDNSGTLMNSGNLNIGLNQIIGRDGIRGSGNFHNTSSGIIQIEETNAAGIALWGPLFKNDGTINIALNNRANREGIYTTSVFENNGIIEIGETGLSGIFSSGTINNSAGASIQITNAGQDGIESAGIFENHSSIIIGSTGQIGRHGLSVYSAGSIFNNNVGGFIQIDNTTAQGLITGNLGIFNNMATINIGQNGMIGNDGIQNFGAFTNNTAGNIQIQNTGASGIALLGSIATFDNNGPIAIDNTGQNGIFNNTDCTFNNNTGASIQIANTNGNGITNSGIFTNSSIINIGVGNDGIQNFSTFTNNAGGNIQIQNIVTNGIVLLGASSTFNNSGSLTIDNTGANGLRNDGNFTNNTSGFIQIDNAGIRGILNNGVFNNTAANILIQNTGASGILNNSGFTFNNNTGASIQIANTNGNGIFNLGLFDNIGNINIGLNGGNIGVHGLENQVTFNNHSSGVINIDNTNGARLENFGSTALFSNAGTINLLGTSGWVAISNEVMATFNNLACAEIFSDKDLRNLSIFTNDGYISFNTTLGHVNSGTFTNNGILNYPQGNPVPNVIDNSISLPSAALMDFCGNQVYNLSGIINPTSATYTFWQDMGATVPAGFYNSSNNTFTPNSPLSGTTTLFVKIDNGNMCPVVVPWVVTVSSGSTITWTGAAGTSDWDTPGNWDLNVVPMLCTEVIIPNVGLSPVINGTTAAFAQSVEVRIGVTLTLDAMSNLTIDGTSGNGLGVRGTVINNGNIQINNVGNDGILNLGTINNSGNISIGANGIISRDGINTNGIFNHLAGTIMVDNTNNTAIANRGSFENYSSIIIGSVGSIGDSGIFVDVNNFNNHPSGSIQINNSRWGITTWPSGSFTNNSSITIQMNPVGSNHGIWNRNLFTNQSGTININGAGKSGVFNESTGNFVNKSTLNISGTGEDGITSPGTFNNSGNIGIGVGGTIGRYGLSVYSANGLFNNNVGGFIQIDNTTAQGLINNAQGVISNYASINIGTNGTIGSQGLIIFQNSTFNNHIEGTIQVDNTNTLNTQFFGGIWIQGIFNNYGFATTTSRIVNFLEINNFGILNSTFSPFGLGNFNGTTDLTLMGVITNAPCAEINLNGPIGNANIITNNGYITVNTTNPSTNNGTFTNNGIVSYPQGNPIPNVTNNPSPLTPVVTIPNLPNEVYWWNAANYNPPPATFSNGFTGSCENSGTIEATVQHFWDKCNGGVILISYNGFDNRGIPISYTGSAQQNGVIVIAVIPDTEAPFGECVAIDQSFSSLEDVPEADGLQSYQDEIASHFSDYSSEVVVTLVGDSGVPECGEDGDFERTYWMEVADECGNVADTCTVTFSGNCNTGSANYCTLSQSFYGGLSNVDSLFGYSSIEILDSLMGFGEDSIILGSGECKFILDDADCIQTIIGGTGTSFPISQSFQQSCTDSLPNTLINQLITTMLNVRYNELFNDGIDFGDLQLSGTCINIPQKILDRMPENPTVNDLIDHANEFMACACDGTCGEFTGYINDQLTGVLLALNSRFHECHVPGPCHDDFTKTLDLDATLKANAVQLDWINNTGGLNDLFIIEQSTDGMLFTEMTTKENASEENTMRGYTLIDDTPRRGMNYYRIKLQLKDGSVLYSNIDKVEIGHDPNQVSIYPNPADQRVFVNLKAYQDKSATITIVNSFGQTMMTKTVNTISNNAISFSLEKLVAGHYTVLIQVEGHKQIAKPLVIAKQWNGNARS